MGYSDQATSPLRRRRGEPRAYDFRRPVRLAREHAHLLRVSMQTFSRQATTVLTTSLRVVCSVSNPRIEELSYDEYLGQMPETSVCAVITMDPLPGKALFTLDLPTALSMIDHQLGGPGSEQQPERPLTDIEQALIRQLLIRVLRELAYALEPIAKVNPQMLTLESDARFVQAAASTDPVVNARMSIAVGGTSSECSICLPFAMLQPALEEIVKSSESGEKARIRQQAAELTQRRLGDVEVDVQVRFNSLRLPSQDVGRLRVGNLLYLGHRTTAPLAVTSATSSGSTVFAHAVPGTSGRKLAVLIVPDP